MAKKLNAEETRKIYQEIYKEKTSLETEIAPKLKRIDEIKEQILKLQEKCKHPNIGEEESRLAGRPYGDKKWETTCPDCKKVVISDDPKGKTDDGPGAPD